MIFAEVRGNRFWEEEIKEESFGMEPETPNSQHSRNLGAAEAVPRAGYQIPTKKCFLTRKPAITVQTPNLYHIGQLCETTAKEAAGLRPRRHPRDEEPGA